MAAVRKMPKCEVKKQQQYSAKMRKIWKNDDINLKVKTKLYETIILSTLLYGAEELPLTATLTKNWTLCITDGRGAY